jgi:hypothetical protein
VMSSFYRWADSEGHTQAVPFTYRSAPVFYAGQTRQAAVNQATRRTPKKHVTIKYLERDFADLFIKGLRGLAPEGARDAAFRGRELARNTAMGELALATGLRRQEFTYLLVWEIPPLPSQPTRMPIQFPVPAGVTKGRKFRTTWISYEALRDLLGHSSALTTESYLRRLGPHTDLPGCLRPRRRRTRANGAGRCRTRGE